ncbi:MAG TPA: Spy/CpxP family protein refolding chaperone [Xanthobacteraceae bacterium]
MRNAAFANAASRDPATRALARSTFQGGFAQSGFRDRRFGDRRGFPGIVIGWVGPVFWPYAYDDFVDYTYWPYGNDTFWPYAYDDVYDGIFGAYAPDYSTAYASVPTRGRRQATRGPVAAGPVAAGLPAAGSAQICSGEASGLTDWPIERIAQQVGPDDVQRTLLDQLKDATAKAVNLLQSACATDLPSTPTGRLAAMRQRTASMLQAVQIVRPALDKFYQSLTDEQKERFIALDAQGAPKATRTANRQQPNLAQAQACGGSTKQVTGLPINQIRQVLHPNDAQQAALDELNNATAQAASLLKENCAQDAQDQPITPPARLAAMETRLSGMLKAIDTVQPAMAKFYNSLTDEQKARFDRLGPRQA